jgi:hypothetical protein
MSEGIASVLAAMVPTLRVDLRITRKSESYASLLILERNTSIGPVPTCPESQTTFSIFSDQLLESANLRKIQSLAATYRKVGHIGKLACKYISALTRRMSWPLRGL